MMHWLRLRLKSIPWRARALAYRVRARLAYLLVRRYGLMLARGSLLARAHEQASNIQRLLNGPAPGSRSQRTQRPNNLRDRVRAAGRSLALQLRAAVENLPGTERQGK